MKERFEQARIQISETREKIFECSNDVSLSELLIQNDRCLLNIIELEARYNAWQADNKKEPLACDESQGELSIIDRISQAVSNIHKQNKKPHFIFLGKLEIKELTDKFPETMERKFSKFSVLDMVMFDCIIIKYPSNSFLGVV